MLPLAYERTKLIRIMVMIFLTFLKKRARLLETFKPIRLQEDQILTTDPLLAPRLRKTGQSDELSCLIMNCDLEGRQKSETVLYFMAPFRASSAEHVETLTVSGNTSFTHFFATDISTRCTICMVKRQNLISN
jgi:hypothetical protein